MLLEALQNIHVPPDISSSARSPKGAQAGLFYRAGDWEQAHKVAQDLNTPEGSFWHGILHRHEEDWSNAAYWFRRVGTHPVYQAIYTDAQNILKGSPWQLSGKWDPLEFIRWNEQASSNQTLVKLQVSEWRHLFDWCICQPVTR